MANQEPPTKKKASAIDCYLHALKTKKPLQIVTNISKNLPTIEVYTGHIKDVKNISKTVLLLNDKIPVKELQHLKRVKKHDIVICPVEHVNGMSIEDYLYDCDENFQSTFDSFDVRNVPKLAPKLKQQFEETKELWPCNFHPDKYLERLFSGNFFSEQEMETHRRYMEVALRIAKWSNVPNVAVVVDPLINSVVAFGVDNRVSHPIQHAAMLAIDNVARTQNGGAWKHNQLDDRTFIDLNLLNYLKEICADVKFGHRQYISKRQEVSTVNTEATDNHEGPYLCTGYYVYIVKEPCVMCSMALVHARVKRIFFSLENEEDGALKSRVKLQTVASLNHHFEVFTGFL